MKNLHLKIPLLENHFSPPKQTRRYLGMACLVLMGFLQPYLSYAQTFNGTTGPIPDPGTFDFTANVTGLPGTIGTDYTIANVTINIQHSWVSDLDISLVGPDGTTTLNLSDDNGDNGFNYTNTVFTDAASINITAGSAPFTGNFQPEGPGTLASVFNGSAVNGIWTLRVTDDLNLEPGTVLSWSITFQAVNPPVVLNCPSSTTTTACQTQSAVNNAFSLWLLTASATGGCNGVLSNNNVAQGGAPPACGGSRTVTFTYTSTCLPFITTCQATFTVPTAPTVSLTCPVSTTTTACQTQAAVNAAFNTWLATASGSGGCNGTLTNNSVSLGGAPSACGGSRTVTFIYTSTCGTSTTTCQATFTVPPAPTVTLTCPTNTTTTACQTQAAVDAAFATWLATASGTGGCNGTLTNNSVALGGAPSACGGSRTVTFTYTSACAPTTTTCQATFTVPAAPTVSLTCPTNQTEAFGQTQAAINAKFATWLATASGSGGCNGALSNNNTGAPPATGGTATVTFTYTSNCAPLTTTCQASFLVSSTPPVVLTCPVNATASSPCLTQAQLTTQYNAWLATASGSGGCDGVLTNNSPGAPSICSATAISQTVEFTYTSTCAPFITTCQATFTVPAYPDFNGPPNSGATRVCLAQTEQPIPPVINDACGKPIIPTGPVVVDAPNPLTCEGTRTYTYTYTDCAGHSKDWSFVWTLDVPTLSVDAPGTFTVPCPSFTPPTYPNTITDACGRPVTFTGPTVTSSPDPITCEGTKTFTWNLTDCAGNTNTWSWIVTIERNDFTLPANGGSTVSCPAAANVVPTPPSKMSQCGEPIIPTGPVVSATPTCEGTKTYTWTYTDCEGNSHDWVYTYTIERNDFTVPANGSATVSCPSAITTPTPPTVTSNCGETLTPTGPVVVNTPDPLTCAGTRVYTYTYTDCEGNTRTWSFTYTVSPTLPVTITCPTNTTTAACQTPVQLNTAYVNWLNTASFSGGCNGSLTSTQGVPSVCGGSTTLTFTHINACGNQSCQATFTVPAPPPVVLTCPTEQLEAFGQTQAAINAKFATWLATATGSGGCNGVLTNNNTGAPPASGGATTVTFTYTSSCAPLTTTCQATFTVSSVPPVVLTCPTNTTTTACQTQAAVNAAFATWLATASGTGGCNGTLTNNNTGAPSACGGSTTVTFTYISTCAPLTTTCQAIFTVPAAPNVSLTCPTNTTVAACQTQAAVNTAFATWLATASASGGCNGVLTNNNTGAPSACGGSTTVTFTYTSTCSPLTTTCQATFTVPAAPTVVLTCPTNTTAAACQTQAAVNSAFATWLATASASGGCNGVLTNNNTGAPSACGGSTTVTFTYTNTCAPLTTTCQATFTVASSPVVLTCPVNTTTTACQTQAAVNTAFATWLATATASGGCNGVLTNNNTGAPSACGGSTTVTFTYTSTCSPLTTTCQATFTVPAAPTVVLTCPTNTTTAACQTQAAVNSAFATWLATASASGGCNGVLTNNNTGAPSACGGSTTVTFTYTSSCAPLTTTCQATFTVPAAPTVVLTCPVNTTTAACQTQAAVNTAFATWLATVSASGGCNGTLTNNNTGAPSACGGSTTVTFTYNSSCAPTTTTCQATFTVPAAPTVVLTCPTNTTAAACQTQAAVNTAFATWLATASASGGCNGVLTNNNTGAPSACGGSTTVTFTYTSSCAPLTTTCQATFTVPSAPTVVLTCPVNTTTAACQTQAAVNSAFATWLATASAIGGCNGVLTNNNTGAPSACGGSTNVTFIYTSSCAPLTTTCQATFTVAAPPTVVLTCPTPTTASACLTQAQLDAAYTAWLASATASGGCNGTLTNNGGTAPLICSATAVTKTVTFTYTSSCAPTTTTCTSTFTVPAYPTFTVPANTASTVACPALIVQPTPPAVVDGCGKALTPTGPVITNAPNPITCEGTRTFVWTYTDCTGLARTWSHVTTVEREPFTVPANGSATVACPANATQPTPPTVTSNCGEVLTPTVTVTNVPNPLTCEGTRTYAFTYTDCESNTATWSFIYTIERQPFNVPADGLAIVDCPDDTDVQPTPPVVTSNCGEVLTPVVTSTAKPGCEGDRIYYFTYTDCEGNTATWQFRYKVEYLDFAVPASETITVNCPVNATQPVPPTVFDNCGKLINPVGPAISSTDNAGGCEASRTYAWTYKDCEGNTHFWSKTYNFAYTADFFPPADEVFEVGCLLYAQPPVPQILYDFCDQQIAVSGPVVEGDDDGCSGYRKYTFTYTDCGGHSYPWTFTYFASDTEAPMGTCPNVDVTDLSCIEEVPCPEEDYDFSTIIAELLEEGNIYDVCSGDDLTVKMDSWTALWECSDLDNDGNYTFGRTFYFRISDACGNEFPSLCGVTYSGKCLPIVTFPQNAWGIPGGEPGITIGSNTTDQEVIAELLGANNPLTIGGVNRSLSLTDATCIVNLLPGTSGPGTLANCHQVNCTGPNGAGCNPLGIGGMKNSLAANAIALHLNLRYNVRYNQLGMNDLRNQRLDCIEFAQSLLYCPPTGGPCVLRIIENPGIAHDFPYTIGGLLDLANLYLNGGLDLTFGQSISYAQALNSAIGTVNTYWHGRSQTAHCSPNAGIPDNQQTFGGGLPATVGKGSTVLGLDLSPNPAGSEVTVRLAGLEEAVEISLEVYNAFGQMVLRKDFGSVGNLKERLDLSGFNDGMYFVSVRAGGERLEQKLVISRD